MAVFQDVEHLTGMNDFLNVLQSLQGEGSWGHSHSIESGGILHCLRYQAYVGVGKIQREERGTVLVYGERYEISRI